MRSYIIDRTTTSTGRRYRLLYCSGGYLEIQHQTPPYSDKPAGQWSALMGAARDSGAWQTLLAEWEALTNA